MFTGGNDIYEPFDELYIDDEEWEQYVFSPLLHHYSFPKRRPLYILELTIAFIVVG